MRATKEAEKIEAVLGGLTKKNQAQVGLKHTRKMRTRFAKNL